MEDFITPGSSPSKQQQAAARTTRLLFQRNSDAGKHQRFDMNSSNATAAISTSQEMATAAKTNAHGPLPLSLTAPIGPPPFNIVGSNADGVLAHGSLMIMPTMPPPPPQQQAQRDVEDMFRDAIHGREYDDAISPVAHRHEAMASDDDDGDHDGEDPVVVGGQHEPTDGQNGQFRSNNGYSTSRNPPPPATATANTTAFMNTSAISRLTSSDEASSVVMAMMMSGAATAVGESDGHAEEGGGGPPTAAVTAASDSNENTSSAPPQTHRDDQLDRQPQHQQHGHDSDEGLHQPNPRLLLSSRDLMVNGRGEEQHARTEPFPEFAGEGIGGGYVEMTPDFHNRQQQKTKPNSLAASSGLPLSSSSATVTPATAKIMQPPFHPPSPSSLTSSAAASPLRMSTLLSSLGVGVNINHPNNGAGSGSSTTPPTSPPTTATAHGAPMMAMTTTTDARREPKNDTSHKQRTFSPPKPPLSSPTNTTREGVISAAIVNGSSVGLSRARDGGGVGSSLQVSPRKRREEEQRQKKLNNAAKINSDEVPSAVVAEEENSAHGATTTTRRRRVSPKAAQHGQDEEGHVIGRLNSGKRTPSSSKKKKKSAIEEESPATEKGIEAATRRRKRKEDGDDDANAENGRMPSITPPSRRITPRSGSGGGGGETKRAAIATRGEGGGYAANTIASSAREADTQNAVRRDDDGDGLGMIGRGGMRFANARRNEQPQKQHNNATGTAAKTKTPPNSRPSSSPRGGAEVEAPDMHLRRKRSSAASTPSATPTKQQRRNITSTASSSQHSSRTPTPQSKAPQQQQRQGRGEADDTFDHHRVQQQQGGRRYSPQPQPLAPDQATISRRAASSTSISPRVVKIYRDPTTPTITSALKMRGKFEDDAVDGHTDGGRPLATHTLPFIVPASGSTTSQHVSNKMAVGSNAAYGQDKDANSVAAKVQYVRVLSPSHHHHSSSRADSRTTPSSRNVSPQQQQQQQTKRRHMIINGKGNEQEGFPTSTTMQGRPSSPSRHSIINHDNSSGGDGNGNVSRVLSPRNSARSPIVRRPCREEALRAEETRIYQSLLSDTAATMEAQQKEVLGLSVVSEGMLRECDERGEDLAINRGAVVEADQRQRRGSSSSSLFPHDDTSLSFSERQRRRPVLSPTRKQAGGDISSSLHHHHLENPTAGGGAKGAVSASPLLPMPSFSPSAFPTTSTTAAAQQQHRHHRSIHINATANNTFVGGGGGGGGGLDANRSGVAVLVEPKRLLSPKRGYAVGNTSSTNANNAGVSGELHHQRSSFIMATDDPTLHQPLLAPNHDAPRPPQTSPTLPTTTAPQKYVPPLHHSFLVSPPTPTSKQQQQQQRQFQNQQIQQQDPSPLSGSVSGGGAHPYFRSAAQQQQVPSPSAAIKMLHHQTQPPSPPLSATSSAAVSPSSMSRQGNENRIHNNNNLSFASAASVPIDSIPEETAAQIFAILQSKDAVIAELSDTVRALHEGSERFEKELAMNEQAKTILLNEIAKLRAKCNAQEVFIVEQKEDIRALKDGTKRITAVSATERNAQQEALVTARLAEQGLHEEIAELKKQIKRLEKHEAKAMEKRHTVEQQRDLFEKELRGLVEEIKHLTTSAAATTAENQSIIDGLSRKLAAAETELVTIQPQTLRLAAADQKANMLEIKLREETLKNIQLVADLRSLRRSEERLALDAQQHEAIAAAMEKRMAELESQLEQFHADTKKAMGERHAAEEELLVVKTQLGLAERAVEAVEHKLSERDALIDGLQEKMASLEANKKALDAEMTNKSSTIDELKDAIEDLQHRIDLQNHTIEIRKEHASTLGEEASELSDRVSLLEAALDEAESRARTAIADRERMLKEKREAERQLNSQAEKHLAKIVEMQSSFSTLTQQQSHLLSQTKKEAQDVKGDLLALQSLFAEKEAQYAAMKDEAAAERRQFITNANELKIAKEVTVSLKAQIAKTEEYVAVLELKTAEADKVVESLRAQIGEQSATIEKQRKSLRLSDDRISSLEKVAKGVKTEQQEVVDMVAKNEELSRLVKGLEVKLAAKTEGLKNALDDRARQQQLAADAHSQLSAEIALHAAKTVKSKSVESKLQREINKLIAERDAAEKDFRLLLSRSHEMEKDANRIFAVLKAVSTTIAKDLVRAMRYTKHKGAHLEHVLLRRVDAATAAAKDRAEAMSERAKDATAENRFLASQQAKYQHCVALLLERNDVLLTKNERLREKVASLRSDLREALILTMEGNAVPTNTVSSSAAMMPPTAAQQQQQPSSMLSSPLPLRAGGSTTAAANIFVSSGPSLLAPAPTAPSSSSPLLSSPSVVDKSIAALMERIGQSTTAAKTTTLFESNTDPTHQSSSSFHHQKEKEGAGSRSHSPATTTTRASSASVRNGENNSGSGHASSKRSVTIASSSSSSSKSRSASPAVAVSFTSRGSNRKEEEDRRADEERGVVGGRGMMAASVLTGISSISPANSATTTAPNVVIDHHHHQHYDFQQDLDRIASEILGCEGGFGQLLGAVALEGAALADRRRRQEALIEKHRQLLTSSSSSSPPVTSSSPTAPHSSSQRQQQDKISITSSSLSSDPSSILDQLLKELSATATGGNTAAPLQHQAGGSGSGGPIVADGLNHDTYLTHHNANREYDDVDSDNGDADHTFIEAYDRAVGQLRRNEKMQIKNKKTSDHPSLKRHGAKKDDNSTTTINIALASAPQDPNIVFYSPVSGGKKDTTGNDDDSYSSSEEEGEDGRHGRSKTTASATKGSVSSKAQRSRTFPSSLSSSSSDDEEEHDDDDEEEDEEDTSIFMTAAATTSNNINNNRHTTSNGAKNNTGNKRPSHATKRKGKFATAVTVTADTDGSAPSPSTATTTMSAQAALAAEEKESARLRTLESHVRDVLLRSFVRELSAASGGGGNNVTTSSLTAAMLPSSSSSSSNENHLATRAGATKVSSSSIPSRAQSPLTPLNVNTTANVRVQSDKRDLVTDLLPLTSRLSGLLLGHLSQPAVTTTTTTTTSFASSSSATRGGRAVAALKNHPLSGRLSQLSVGELFVKCVDAYLNLPPASNPSQKA